MCSPFLGSPRTTYYVVVIGAPAVVAGGPSFLKAKVRIAFRLDRVPMAAVQRALIGAGSRA
jgi:hypothetical protein